LFLCIGLTAIAQETSLRGVILDANNSKPVEGISVQLKNAGLEIKTGLDGIFLFEKVAPGTETISISSPDIMVIEFPVEIVPYKSNDIGSIYVTPNFSQRVNSLGEDALILIEEENFGDDSDVGDFNVSSLMTSSNDVYISNTTYNFSAMRFKLRGYDNRYSDVYINGIRFNDPIRGGFSYGLIGGLNDATRNKDIVNYQTASNYTYGQVGGSSNIITNASSYAPGVRASVAYTNRAYMLRGMGTFSTGLMDNGWAVTGSVGYRWADEGYVDGTFYNSLGYFFSIEKIIDKKHSISFTTLGSPTQRAQQSANTQETIDLTGDYQYNSYWGWQDGKKRNSRIVTAYEPAAILSHKLQFDKNTRLTTSLGFKYTMYGSTALGWDNAADPRPDYYRYFPSWQTNDEDALLYEDAWKNGGRAQINWEQLYQHNLGNAFDPAKNEASSYYVEERHSNQLMLSLNSVINSRISENNTFTAGIEGSMSKGMFYKTMDDLLGGQFFKDIDTYSIREKVKENYYEGLEQNDLRNPDRLVTEGDRFGYDYNVFVKNANVWFQNNYRYNKWDYYYGFKLDYTNFYRHGNMQNGRAPENSYGKGDMHDFITYSAKFGATYKLDGRHMFSGNISYSTLPPLANNSYVSVRIKDNIIPNLQEEKVFAADISYHLSTPIFRGRLTAFQTNFKDQTQRYSYYYDGASGSGSLLNYSLTGVDKTHRGIEFALETKLNSIFSISVAGTVSEYFYTNRPTAYASYENGLDEDFSETVYLKNYHVGATPELAGSIGLHAFYNYWFFDLNLNAFDNTYIGLSPNRRTAQAVDFVTETEEEWEDIAHSILKQEKFKGGFLLDFSVGKSIRINRKYTLNLNCQFQNILNNKKMKTGGYEQSRFDYSDGDASKFPSKYYYAQGFNVFLNAGLRF